MDENIEIKCPLCCDETFTSHSSLKYHLLSIADNLQCNVCSRRFDTILSLAEHVGKKCDDGDVNVNDEDDVIESINEESVNENDDIEVTKELENSKFHQVDIKEEKSQDHQYDSILAKALMRSDEEHDKEKDVEDGKDGDEEKEEECFYCSSCDMSFSSINEHLTKYHSGQEVYVQNDEDSEQTSEIFVFGDDKEAGGESDDNEEENNDGTGHTLDQQEVSDKDGRLYTRKVVQIEKFWDKSKKPPVTQRYYIENDKAMKLDGEVIGIDEANIFSIHQCTVCSINFRSLDHYYSHNCDPKSNASDYKCGKCGDEFFNVRALTAHMKIHKNEKARKGPYVCDMCSTEFPSFKSLRLHKRMHEPVKSKEIEPPVNYGITGEPDAAKGSVRVMFICRVCNKAYDKQYEEAHMRSHNAEKDYDCEICNRKFHTATNLEMHMKVHTNGKKFTCSYCKKGFLSYENLQNHVKNSCQSRPYECQWCGRRFLRPHEKVKHERIHTGEKPHICEICGKAFRVSYCLTLHMRTHSGTRPYQCDHCGKRFKAHSVYNHHLLTHSQVRNYKCPYCPKAFKTGVQLAGHKNSHTKPFTCTECNRPFASLYAVRAHMDTHKRENNLKYKCDICGASYARGFALRDHVKEHHADVNVDDVNAINGQEFIEEDAEFKMVTEDLNATTMILKSSDGNSDITISNLVVLNENMEGVEIVEEVNG